MDNYQRITEMVVTTRLNKQELLREHDITQLGALERFITSTHFHIKNAPTDIGNGGEDGGGSGLTMESPDQEEIDDEMKGEMKNEYLANLEYNYGVVNQAIAQKEKADLYGIMGFPMKFHKN